MRLDEIKEKVIAGELKLDKTELGTITRRKYIYSKTKGSYVGEYKIFVPDIERVDIITYSKVECRAMIDKDRGYRISKKVYDELLKQNG